MYFVSNRCDSTCFVLRKNIIAAFLASFSRYSHACFLCWTLWLRYKFLELSFNLKEKRKNNFETDQPNRILKIFRYFCLYFQQIVWCCKNLRTSKLSITTPILIFSCIPRNCMFYNTQWSIELINMSCWPAWLLFPGICKHLTWKRNKNRSFKTNSTLGSQF